MGLYKDLRIIIPCAVLKRIHYLKHLPSFYSINMYWLWLIEQVACVRFQVIVFPLSCNVSALCSRITLVRSVSLTYLKIFNLSAVRLHIHSILYLPWSLSFLWSLPYLSPASPVSLMWNIWPLEAYVTLSKPLLNRQKAGIKSKRIIPVCLTHACKMLTLSCCEVFPQGLDEQVWNCYDL